KHRAFRRMNREAEGRRIIDRAPQILDYPTRDDNKREQARERPRQPLAPIEARHRSRTGDDSGFRMAGQSLEREREIVRRLEPRGRTLLQTSIDDARERRRNVALRHREIGWI